LRIVHRGYWATATIDDWNGNNSAVGDTWRCASRPPVFDTP
jgi:hypothetical protein